ncbi:MobC family plasmid mobilization relaxosome protein [Micromonospora aurantiaca]|nr:MobC family plasmid mobilization relaxosome protein [Micromonospora aurantiaca]
MDSDQPVWPRKARHRAHNRPARPHAVLLRLSDEEKASIDAAAAAAQLTPTGYAAKAAVAAASARQPGGVNGDLRDLQHELFAARRAVAMFGNNVNQAAAAFNATGRLPDWAAEAVRLCTRVVARLDEVISAIDRKLR